MNENATTAPITTDTPMGAKVTRVFPASYINGSASILVGYNARQGRVTLAHADGTRSGEPDSNWEVMV